jgi:hypothetical protein
MQVARVNFKGRAKSAVVKTVLGHKPETVRVWQIHILIRHFIFPQVPNDNFRLYLRCRAAWTWSRPLTSSGAEVNNEWSCTSSPHCVPSNGGQRKLYVSFAGHILRKLLAFLPEYPTRFLLPLCANRVTGIVSEKLCAFSDLLKLQYVTCVGRRLGSRDR